MSKGWVFKAIASGAISAVSKQLFLTYFAPVIFPLMVGFLGYIQDYPWMYISVCVFASFSFITHGLLNFSVWRVNQEIAGKLVFDGINIGIDLETKGIVLGFRVLNRAHFPIEFSVEKLSTRMGTTLPYKSTFLTKNIIVEPGNLGWFNDHSIKLREEEKINTVEGFIDFSIKYGRIGSLSEEISGKKQVLVEFDDNKNIIGRVWNNAS